MHKIYEDYGAFNFLFQLPQVLYSTIISSIIALIMKYLALTEKAISEIKKCNDMTKINKTIKFMKIKLIMYFILTSMFLVIFWYYLSCFCAVYKDTQVQLLKDTIISFGCSLIYPFGLNLLPGFFKIPALKLENKEGYYLYIISKIIQMI